jgi:hypothetical protein
MATTKEPTSQVDLGDFIEATITAVERASNGRRLGLPPGATVGIIFQPPWGDGSTTPIPLSMTTFAAEIASRAGELHAKFVTEALENGASREQRFQRSLTAMVDLGIMSDDEASMISEMRTSVRDSARSVAASYREVKSALDSLRSSDTASPVTRSIVGVYADSLARENESLGPRATARAAAKSKGIAGSDGEGAVEGGGFGGLIGAEVGGAAGGIGALPGALLGGLFGAIIGGAIQSIGAALDDDDD